MPKDNDFLVWSGNKHLIATGTLLTFGEQWTDFDLFVNGDRATIRFAFARDTGAPRAESALVDGGHITLTFYNLTSGAFSAGPALLGTIGGNGIYLAYEVASAVGLRDTRKIAYTFWEGPNPQHPGAGLLGIQRA